MKRLALVAILAAAVGCSTTPCGMKLVTSSASTINLADINWDEYKWPVFSTYSGPRITVWVNKDFLALSKLAAWGSVTNDVVALGIYSAKESKTVGANISFRPVSTNGVVELEAVAPSPREAETKAEEPPGD